MSDLDSAERQFRVAKISGAWQRWILEVSNPWGTPPWHPQAAAVVHGRPRKGDDIKAIARQFFDEELRVFEEMLRKRRQAAALESYPIDYHFRQIHEMFVPDLLRSAREEFAEYVCLHGPKAGEVHATRDPGHEVEGDAAGGMRNADSGKHAASYPWDVSDPWNIRLEKMRLSLGLDRPQAVKRLGECGYSTTVATIKKHEEGKHRPLNEIARKAYAKLYNLPEDELFRGMPLGKRPRTPKNNKSH